MIRGLEGDLERPWTELQKHPVFDGPHMQAKEPLDLAPPAKKLTLPLQMAIAVALIGVFFNLQHWPAAGILTLSGLAGIMILYPFRWAAKRSKGLLDHVKLLLALSWPAGVGFSIMHWPYATVFQLVAAPCFLIWVFMAGIGEFWNDRLSPSPSRSSIIMYGLSFALIIAGTVFRIQHWPYGNAMLIGGFACCALWFAIEFLGRRNKDRKQIEPSDGEKGRQP